MANQSKIEWTDATWNPWHGCTKVSAGCKNCYMYRDKARYGQDPSMVVKSKSTFYDPISWTKPRMIFTCSWSDFFIEEADAWRKDAWGIIRATPHHVYQILTKRPERIAANLPNDWGNGYRNVWLGISIEDQATADERVPKLQIIPAFIRWISIEPLLEQIDLWKYLSVIDRPHQWLKLIDWIVVGGESGPNARPMREEWAFLLREQARVNGVKFFMKQGSQANWKNFKDFDSFPPELQVREYPIAMPQYSDGTIHRSAHKNER